MISTFFNQAIFWQILFQDPSTILIIGILFSFYLYEILSKDKKKDIVNVIKKLKLKGVHTPNSSDSGEPR